MGRTRSAALVAAVLCLLLTGAGPALAHEDDEPERPAQVAGQDVRSATCDDSDLPAHTGFQVAPACVSTEFGEVSDGTKNPQLLIVDFPAKLKVGQPVVLKVSTRNLVRDRFLPAGQGGYYLERAELNGDGLTRGHFHTACRLLGDTSVAPTPDRNAQFVATEDGKGGAAPDVVTVTLPPFAKAGQAQCAAWAGDSSHRMPMMQFANQVPAFDLVRIKVRDRD